MFVGRDEQRHDHVDIEQVSQGKLARRSRTLAEVSTGAPAAAEMMKAPVRGERTSLALGAAALRGKAMRRRYAETLSLRRRAASRMAHSSATVALNVSVGTDKSVIRPRGASMHVQVSDGMTGERNRKHTIGNRVESGEQNKEGKCIVTRALITVRPRSGGAGGLIRRPDLGLHAAGLALDDEGRLIVVFPMEP
jgi:hypothetical protein